VSFSNHACIFLYAETNSEPIAAESLTGVPTAWLSGIHLSSSVIVRSLRHKIAVYSSSAVRAQSRRLLNRPSASYRVVATKLISIYSVVTVNCFCPTLFV